ncbi:amidohydrolase family protein [Leptobacterium flavescens]|uniref:Amidohydrolase family protein n=1 Tax=Leptobacterium flavescens TaxID=472055 RepID=A0A6P0UHL2_9FLAO|nr:amidohydrolase family protein [Leptobacterium flavescens]NER11940.1 amidohydrolase family protein [Leptobacterium flavescens]
MNRKNLLLLVFGLTVLTTYSQQILLKADHFFDSEKGKFLNDIEVLVKNNRIVKVGKNLSYDKETTQVKDLGNATILPGLIDAHTHLLIEEELHPSYAGFGETVIKALITKSDAKRALEGSSRAISYLHEGFTSIRDLGNSGLYADVDLRNAINDGLLQGPRMFVSGPGIAAIGGQLNGLSARNIHLAEKEYQTVSNVNDAVKAIRQHVLMRVDVIKLYADNIPNQTTLSLDELKTLSEESKASRKPVAAHAITDQAVWNAAMADVNSIEHAYNVSDSTLARVIERKITLVPTYSDREVMSELFKNYGITDSLRRSRILDRSAKRQQQSLSKLYKSGVKLAYGSDFYSKTSLGRGKAAKHGIFAYLEAGIPLEKVLQYATINASELLGKNVKLGIVKESYLADIIAVKGNLKNNPEALHECILIMKNGKLIK